MSENQRARLVSVVVPVYNPGPHLDKLLASLAAQTMPQEHFELILADDGSTDDTPARLDRLAAEHENVRVRHDPNSGWPGRPRNLGLDMAVGEYVFFVDQDDWLGVEALERMYAYGAEHRADLVIGRYAGHKRGVAKAPFARSRPDATLANTPLMDSLTPHKMFRAQFLREQQLRFPEGRRRLEDHVFVTQAYFRAERIAIVADYHCYFHVRRDDEGNAGYQRIDPPSYYGYVREVVDIVLANTEPGTVRDRCLRRSLRTELLGRLDGRGFLKQPAAYQQSLFDNARSLAVETMPLSVDAGLSPPQRVRAELLRAGRLPDLLAVVGCYVETRPVARLVELGWDDDGLLRISAEAGLVDSRSGEPWPYELDGDAAYLRTPEGLDGPFPRDAAECTKQLAGASAVVVLRRREDSEEWVAPTQSSAVTQRDGSRASVRLTASARVDPMRVGGGRPLTDGVWDVFVRVNQTGWTKDARLGSIRTETATSGRRAAILGHEVVLPYWTKPHDNLSIDVAAPLDRAIRHLRADEVSVRLDRNIEPALRVVAPVTVPSGAQPAGAELSGRAVLRDRERVIEAAATFERTGSGELAITVAPTPAETGVWSVEIVVDGVTGTIPLAPTLVVDASGPALGSPVKRTAPAVEPDDVPAPRKAPILRRVARRVRRELRDRR